jgi:hypothetical protein
VASVRMGTVCENKSDQLQLVYFTVSVDNKKMYSIKFNYNGEVRRAQVSVEDGAQIISFDNVAAVARNLFMIEKPVKLQWTDDEGDTISCRTDAQLADAIRVMSSQNKTAFKFDVVVLGASTSTTPSIAAPAPPQAVGATL